MEAGKPQRQDGEYIRNGNMQIFLFTEPLAGWRHVRPVREETKIDWQTKFVSV